MVGYTIGIFRHEYILCYLCCSRSENWSLSWTTKPRFLRITFRWYNIYVLIPVFCIVATYELLEREVVYELCKLECLPSPHGPLVQALRLCTGCTAHRGRRGIALPFHDHGTRREWGVSITPRPLFTPGKDPVFIIQEDPLCLRKITTDLHILVDINIGCTDDTY
jgi:hypothetical protein